MFYERDMKLSEIIKFANSVIKRNNKLYSKMFLFAALWSVLIICVSSLYMKTEEDIFVIFILLLELTTFAIFLAIKKIIYNSIYDENYSENYDTKDILNYVKNRYFRVLFNIIKMGIVIIVAEFIIVLLPVDFFMTEEKVIMAIVWLVYLVVAGFFGLVFFIYYVMELSLNNNVKVARYEVISVLKVKKLNAILTVVPLGLFSGLLYFGASAVVEFITSSTDYFGLILYCIFLIVFFMITLYLEVLWIVKYYNMKNAIIYKLTNSNNVKNVEAKRTKSVVSNDKSVENTRAIGGMKNLVSDKKTVKTESVVNDKRTVNIENAVSDKRTVKKESVVNDKRTVNIENAVSDKRIVKTESVVSDKRTINIDNAVSKEDIVNNEKIVGTELAPNDEIPVNKEIVADSNNNVSKENGFDERRKQKEVNNDAIKENARQNKQQNSDEKSNIVGEDSMWGTTVSIEDSIIGRD